MESFSGEGGEKLFGEYFMSALGRFAEGMKTLKREEFEGGRSLMSINKIKLRVECV